jgi:streptomycin 6-kinase
MPCGFLLLSDRASSRLGLPDAQAITGLLDTIVENGRLDRARAVAWGVVRSIDYWLWGVANGLTGDPLRCSA